MILSPTNIFAGNNFIFVITETRRMDPGCERGFTLIGLFLVVAIVLISIAAALPNFLEALARGKVTKAEAGIPTLVVASVMPQL